MLQTPFSDHPGAPLDTLKQLTINTLSSKSPAPEYGSLLALSRHGTMKQATNESAP